MRPSTQSTSESGATAGLDWRDAVPVIRSMPAPPALRAELLVTRSRSDGLSYRCRLRRATAALTSILLAASVTSCSDAKEKAPTPSNTPSPSPTTIRFAKNSYGAQDFAKLYFARYNASLGTGDTHAVRELQVANCSSCRQLNEIVERAYAVGGRIDGGRIKVLFVAAPGFTGNKVSVTCIVNQAAGRVLTASGRVSSRIAPALRADDEVSLVWTASGWMISDIRRFRS